MGERLGAITKHRHKREHSVNSRKPIYMSTCSEPKKLRSSGQFHKAINVEELLY